MRFSVLPKPSKAFCVLWRRDYFRALWRRDGIAYPRGPRSTGMLPPLLGLAWPGLDDEV